MVSPSTKTRSSLSTNTGIKGQHVRRLRMVDGFELARSASLHHPIEFAMAGNLLFVPSWFPSSRLRCRCETRKRW